MRYTEEYNEWARRIERMGAAYPSQRERAACIASKIRNGHSGSTQDQYELQRMERIARMQGRY